MLQPLKIRNFAYLWLAQVISGTGDVFYTVGIMVTIFERTGSALQTAGVMVATTLPPFLLGPFAGALVDAYARRRVMISMDLIRSLLVSLLLLFLQNSYFNLWGIYLVVSGLAAATAFYTPARQAIIPALVPRQQLVNANSLILGTRQATMATGFLLGGILILQFGFQTLVLINLGTFMIGSFLIWLIRDGLPATAVSTRAPLWQSIRDGFAYLRQQEPARSLVVMEVLEHIPHGVWTSALMLVFVQQALGGSANDWGLHNGAFYAGQIVGALAAAVAAGWMAIRPGWVIIGNAFILSFLTVGYALSPTNALAVLISFLFGPPFALRDVSQDSLLQATVDENMIGRVYALRNMGWNLMFMMSGLVFAWLADQTPIRSIYLLAGGLYAVTAVFALSRRALRQATLKEPALSWNPAAGD